MPTMPTEEEVLGYFQTLSNWGRWGADDQIGALNLITPAKRRDAAALVSEGVSVSCAWDIQSAAEPDPAYRRPQRLMLGTGEDLPDPAGGTRHGFAWEFIGLIYHGFAVTHLDSIAHVFWDKKMYNGVPAERVTKQEGAQDFAVSVLKDGVVSRGVLLDVAAAQGQEVAGPRRARVPRGSGGRRTARERARERGRRAVPSDGVRAAAASAQGGSGRHQRHRELAGGVPAVAARARRGDDRVPTPRTT